MAPPKTPAAATNHYRLKAKPEADLAGSYLDVTATTADRVGCVLLLTLALPVIALAATAVVLTSPGPVMTRSARIAGNGRIVVLHQFRTTYGDAGGERVYGGHSRAVTPIGVILQMSGVANLPVLTDVWAGRIGLMDALRL